MSRLFGYDEPAPAAPGEKNGKGATPVRAKATKIILLESKVRQLERELAQACLERNAARNVLARAIDRERLANMRATEWEEAAEAAQKLAAHYEQSYIALDVHMRNCPQSATAPLPAEIVEAVQSAITSAQVGELAGWEIDLIERRICSHAYKLRTADNRSADKGQG
jgi:hypothetical protein